jgi:hypothetical protein
MRNINPMQINQTGTITIADGRIDIEGFEFSNASCREGAIMACAWAIGELQREMLKDIQAPGGSNSIVIN